MRDGGGWAGLKIKIRSAEVRVMSQSGNTQNGLYGLYMLISIRLHSCAYCVCCVLLVVPIACPGVIVIG